MELGGEQAQSGFHSCLRAQIRLLNVPNQKRQVGGIKAQAWRGNAMTFDVWGNMFVMLVSISDRERRGVQGGQHGFHLLLKQSLVLCLPGLENLVQPHPFEEF
jgi:hypothetical protein